MRRPVPGVAAAGTALRPPTPARQSAVTPPTRRSGRWWTPVAVGVAVAAVAGMAVGGARLLGEPEDAQKAAATTAEAAPTIGTSAAASPTRATPTQPPRTPKRSTSPKAATSSPTSVPVSSAAPTVPAPPTPTEACWDGRPVYDAADCSTPVGRTGLHAVFPSLEDSCVPRPPKEVGKIEVFTCYYSDFLLRYSRWDPTADRHAYLDQANYMPLKNPWSVDFETAGGEWWSEDHSDGQTRPYQWSATYDDAPYSVSVEGTSKGARGAGIDFLDATPPSRLGLAP